MSKQPAMHRGVTFDSGHRRHLRPRPRRLLPLVVMTVCLAVAGSVLVPMATQSAPPAQASAVNFSESFRNATLDTNPSNWKVSYSQSGADGVNAPPCLTAMTTGTLNLGSGTLQPCANPSTNDPPVGGTAQGALRLIADAGTGKAYQAASMIYQVAQDASAGLDISFKMALWDDTEAADGLVFFLKDGANTNDVAGATGGALGYSPAGSTPGAPGALLGVAFDKWENFSGDVNQCPAPGIKGVGAKRSSIVVRGPDTSSSKNGTAGYCYLGGVQDPAYVSNPSLPANPYQGTYFSGSDRATAARQVRIVVEDDSVPSPKVKVFFGAVGVAQSTPVLEVPLPTELGNAATFKFGFTAGSGFYKTSAAVWDLAISPAPTPVKVTAPNGTMTAGSTPPALGAATVTEVMNPSTTVTLTTAPTCSVYDSSGTNPVTLSSSTPVGTYVVKCTGGSRTGYAIDSYVNGTFTVTSAPPAPPPGPSSEESSSPPEPAPSTPPTRPIGTLDPIPNQVNRNVPAAPMPPGQALYLVDGQPRDVRIAPDAPRDATGIQATGDGWWMKLVGRGDDADPLGLTEKQVLILQSDQPVRTRQGTTKRRVNPVAQASGAGFKANSAVKFYLLPSTYLGQLPTDGSGAFAGKIPVPPGIPPAAYTLQMNGFSPNDSVRSLSIGVIVKPTARVTRQARAVVTFDSLDPTLDAAARKVLKKLLRKTGKLGIRNVVLGFVQPTSISGNDASLSTERARNVAAFLKSRGLKGTYVVRGEGKAPERTAIARRVVVTVTYEVR